MSKKYFIKCSVGAGMNSCELEVFKSYDEAENYARESCLELASEYGYYNDEDYFGDLDQLYQEDSWDEETEEYTDLGELEYYVEEYDPEEHDGELY